MSEAISVEVKEVLRELEKVEGKPSVIDWWLDVSIVNVISNVLTGNVAYLNRAYRHYKDVL